jgi:hypothetical protein
MVPKGCHLYWKMIAKGDFPDCFKHGVDHLPLHFSFILKSEDQPMQAAGPTNGQAALGGKV